MVRGGLEEGRLEGCEVRGLYARVLKLVRKYWDRDCESLFAVSRWLGLGVSMILRPLICGRSIDRIGSGRYPIFLYGWLHREMCPRCVDQKGLSERKPAGTRQAT